MTPEPDEFDWIELAVAVAVAAALVGVWAALVP